MASLQPTSPLPFRGNQINALVRSEKRDGPRRGGQGSAPHERSAGGWERAGSSLPFLPLPACSYCALQPHLGMDPSFSCRRGQSRADLPSPKAGKGTCMSQHRRLGPASPSRCHSVPLGHTTWHGPSEALHSQCWVALPNASLLARERTVQPFGLLGAEWAACQGGCGHATKSQRAWGQLLGAVPGCRGMCSREPCPSFLRYYRECVSTVRGQLPYSSI